MFIKAQCLKTYYRICTLDHENPVHEAVAQDDETRDRRWTKIKKKPFTVLAKETISDWDLPPTPDLETARYPVVPPWYNIEEKLHLELEAPVNKQMNKEHVKQIILCLP